jgi:hypothetical protein
MTAKMGSEVTVKISFQRLDTATEVHVAVFYPFSAVTQTALCLLLSTAFSFQFIIH